jgi:hypothetical protein
MAKLNRNVFDRIRPFLFRDGTEAWFYVIPSEVPPGVLAPDLRE